MTRFVKFFWLAVVWVGVVPTAVAWAQGGLQQRIAELSQQIASEMTQYQKTTIAVVEFSDLQGNVTDFGRFLAEELITRLYQTRKFKVIERQLLNKIIAEQKLTLSGLVDPASARQLGKVLGVEAIASGTVTDLGQSLRINARLITAETGEVFAVASTEIFKDESVTRLLAAGVNQPAGGPGAPPPSGVRGASGRGLAVGRVIELPGISVEGQEIRIRIMSLEMLPDQRLRVVFFEENKSNSIYYETFYQGYIVDDRGDQYNAVATEGFPANGRRPIPPGSGIRFAVLFKAPPVDAKRLFVVVKTGIWDVPQATFPAITVP